MITFTGICWVQLVSWSLTSLFSTNMAISETNMLSTAKSANSLSNSFYGLLFNTLWHSLWTWSKQDFCSALYWENSPVKRSVMARVDNGSHSFTCRRHVHPQTEWVDHTYLCVTRRPAKGGHVLIFSVLSSVRQALPKRLKMFGILILLLIALYTF